ncbi:uncharacterized protein LOC134208878 [Armigeres subalbatus]|uniref:uncharacterized protein LOC134208878 n=1 Tax=Armigeres subalbatus TaxID=124917 RepID=UPI002ED0FBB3
MIQILFFVMLGSLFAVSRADETIIQENSEARQSYPDNPYFHSVAYPFGYGWGIAAYVFIVFKAVFLFTSFVVWAYSEAGFTKRDHGRASEYQWIDSIVQLVAPRTSEDCRREVICEAEAYVAGNPILRLMSQFGGGMGGECKMATFSGECSAITIQDVIFSQLRPMLRRPSNVNWGSSLLNKFL